MDKGRKPVVRRWWFFPAVAVALAGFVVAVLFTCVVMNASRMDDPIPSDVIIVLGASIDANGTPMPMLERRLNRALDLYNEGYAPVIIVTGAQGDDEPTTEASAMRAYLIERGVPEDAVLEEDASYNTRENLSNAKMIMEERGLVTALVVTSDYHLWRALSLCADMDIPASGAGAQNALTFLKAMTNCARESLSWVKYLLQCWLPIPD